MPMVTPPLGVPLRLDSANEWVWRGEQSLQLTSKAFAVLRYLVEHLGQVVTKEELLRTVWSDTVVSEWVLTTCIREIRKALGEAAGAPQYIATVHRRGYRFIGPMRNAEWGVRSQEQPREHDPYSAFRILHSAFFQLAPSSRTIARSSNGCFSVPMIW